jgi:hypothetical protein
MENKSSSTKTEKSPEEKIWENLTKEYLTLDQKLAIIREYNGGLAFTEWHKTIAALRDYIEKHNK